MADQLASTRVVVAGGDRRIAAALAAALVDAGCPAVERVPGVREAVDRVIADPPDVIVAFPEEAAALRVVLDPLGSGALPVVEFSPAEDPQAAAIGRVRTDLERHGLRRRLADLEPVVAAQAVARSRERDAGVLEGLRRLGIAAAYRDDNTREHTLRVAHLAARLGRGLGLGERSVWLLRHAAPLHDVGKIAIPDTILLKPGKLSDDEFEVVKSHTVIGARILADGESDVVGAAAQIVRSHHERWDGNGYPDGTAGADIPVLARVVKVADVFDILVHERPHKEAWTDEQAAGEIAAGAGTQFDPDITRAFAELGPHSWRTPPELLDL